MSEEKQISEQESLRIIRQMIDTAKTEQKDNGMGWITWGWLLFAASLLTIANINFEWVEDLYLFWNIFGAVSFVLLLWGMIRKRVISKKAGVKTYTSDLFNKLNAGFFISLMFIIVAINIGARAVYHFSENDAAANVAVNIGFALLINLYAFWILVYGAALNFRPSIYGAYASWALGLAAMIFANTFEQVMYFHAAAVLVGYIIPGHLANKEFQKAHRKEKI
jgi:hypothetical protein